MYNHDFLQVQFRLKQICDAPTDKKEQLLKELEEFAFRGIPDIQSNLLINSRSSSPTSPIKQNVKFIRLYSQN